MRFAPWSTASVSLLLSWTVLLAPGQQETTGASGEPTRPFTHAKHVQDGWYRGDVEEVWRDCRACHVYDPEDKDFRRDPQEVCGNCHYRGEFELQARPGWEKNLDALHKEVDVAGFWHRDHLNLACRACHGPQYDLRTARLRPWRQKSELGSLNVPSNLGACVACHEDEPQIPFEDIEAVAGATIQPAQELSESFLDALNASESMGPTQLKKFLHNEHMPNLTPEDADVTAAMSVEKLLEGKGTDRNCGACHTPVFDWAGSEPPAPEFATSTNCADCHLEQPDPPPDRPMTRADGLPMSFEERPEAERTESVALGTFDHKLHLRPESLRKMAGVDPGPGAVSNREGYESIANKGCIVCHEYSESEIDFVVGKLLRDEGRGPHRSDTFEGCAECHSEPQWNTFHGDWSQPTRDSQGERQPGACTTCHAFGQDMKNDRLRVSVRRPNPSTFRIEGQAHLGITGKSAQECSRCHLAPVEQLPSRLEPQEFSHDTHLPETPTPADCGLCHDKTISATDGPEEIGLTYDVDSCATCHFGSVITPDMGEGEPKNPFDFPHQFHIGRQWNGAPMDCITCHTPAGGFAGKGIGTPSDVEDCSKCHDHGEHWRDTGHVDRVGVDACAKCHTQLAGGVPALEKRAFVTHAEIASISGVQLHPAGESCSTCHMVEEWLPGRGVRQISVGTFGRELGGPADEPDIHGPLLPHEPSGPVLPTQCLDCHWGRRVDGADDPAKERDSLGNDTTTADQQTYPGRRDLFEMFNR